jgi:predicted acylesterase/phospholipase RssA
MHGSVNRRERTGLVLTGGGAKGAYQIGCLKALRDAGYTRFDAIAGTSVGAMNGVLLASGKLDWAEHAWRTLRARDVIGIRPRKLLLLPVWAVAWTLSEFSLGKSLRLSGAVLSPTRRALANLASPGEDGRKTWWGRIASPALSFVTLVDDWARRIFLNWIFTTNEPLAIRLRTLFTEEDATALRDADVPIYATLSCYHGRDGWVPRYVRIDKLGRQGILDTLLQSSGFPGVFPAPKFLDRHAVDGGWTDNTPAAPLLFDPDLDLDTLFVIKVDKAVAHESRRGRLAARLFGQPDADRALRPAVADWDVAEHSTGHWRAHLRHHLGMPESEIRRQIPMVPRTITVVPSRPLGDLYTGTFWFSKEKANRLVELGEEDMRAALANADRHAERESPAAFVPAVLAASPE